MKMSLIVLAITLSACGDGGGGNGGSIGPMCTITVDGNLMYCYKFGAGYDDANVRPVCNANTGTSVGARVSSCPGENVVGTCSVSGKSGAGEHTYDQIMYGSNNATCESAKQVCDAMNTNSMSSTFVGNGCK